MKEQNETGQERQDRTETGQTNTKRSLPKDHLSYWEGRLKKRHYTDREGKRVEVPEWQIRLFHQGRESWFNLGTANKNAAAAKARTVSLHLAAHGWDATHAKFKSEAGRAPKVDLTVGAFLRAVEGTRYLKERTFLNYQNCFRTILSEVFGIKADKSRFDYRTGGNQRWTQRIDSIRLERVTPARVTSWQERRIKQAGRSPVALSSAKRTVRSYIRCARSLFSDVIQKRLPLICLPVGLPFDGVEMPEAGSMKYISKLNVQALIAAAQNELKPNEPEAYKAFLLGLFAGMRRSEIDSVEWGMVDRTNNLIRLQETEWLSLKSQDSAREITIDKELLNELGELMPAGNSRFIIASDRPPRNDSPRPYYRCLPTFRLLTDWLRSKNVTANKPLHEMRKEIGALIAKQDGILAASLFLGHDDITTTARHYADKARITVGLGKFLDTSIKPVPEKAISAENAAA